MTGWFEHWLRIRSIDWRVEEPTNMRAYHRWLKTYRLEYIDFSFSFPTPASNTPPHTHTLWKLGYYSLTLQTINHAHSNIVQSHELPDNKSSQWPVSIWKMSQKWAQLDLLSLPIWLNFETHSTILYSNTALSVHFCLLTCGSHRWVDSVASHIQEHVDWCRAELGAHLFWFTEYGWQVEVLWSRWWGEDSECSHHMLLFPVSASETYTTWQAFSNTDEKFYRKSWAIF